MIYYLTGESLDVTKEDSSFLEVLKNLPARVDL